MTTTETAAKTCVNCANWSAKDGDQGECRVRAPQLVAFRVDENTEFVSRFPLTASTDWCGEFADK